MPSQHPLSPLREAETQAEQLVDELFGELEDSFDTYDVTGAPFGYSALPHGYGGSGIYTPPPERRQLERLPSWLAGGAGALAIAGIALWWSYIRLPNPVTPPSPVTAAVPGSSVASTVSPESAPTSSVHAAAESPVAEPNPASSNTTAPLAPASLLKTSSGLDDLATSVEEAVAASALPSKPEPQPPSETTTASVSPSPAIAPPPPAPIPPPVVTAAAPPPAPAYGTSPPVSQTLPEIDLVGILQPGGDGQAALFMVGNVMKSVSLGETAAENWVVTDIRPGQVQLSNGSRSFTLQLGLSSL